MKSHQRFTREFQSLLKANCSSYDVNDDGIPLFSARTAEELKKDKYEEEGGQSDKYLSLYAYGYQTAHAGEAESLYQTVDAAVMRELSNRKGEYAVLDIGCGVGRSIYDCAELYPNALFVGMDFSYRMLSLAKKMLTSGTPFPFDVTFAGIRKVILQPKNLHNVVLAQGSVLDLPFQDNIFDVLINTYLIDRVSNPSCAIQEMTRVMKKHGMLIFTDPLDWQDSVKWKKYPNREKLLREFTKQGLEVEEWFDGMIFREVKEARGNYSDWKTLVIKARKR